MRVGYSGHVLVCVVALCSVMRLFACVGCAGCVASCVCGLVAMVAGCCLFVM